MTELQDLAALRQEAEWLQFTKRSDAAAWQAAWRQHDRWAVRWAREWNGFLLKQQTDVDVERLVKVGQRAWGKGRLRKATTPPPPEGVAASTEAIVAALAAQVGTEAFTNAGGAVYSKLAYDIGEDAGQFTLEALGLGKTFAWASIRDFPQRQFMVRGSKVIAQHYDNHLGELGRLVAEKCNPAAPKTIGQLTREIKHEWPAITRRDALRVARTESANVWETVNWNAMQLNGVTRVDWLIARGPSIGTKTAGPVCKQCLAMAAQTPFVLDELEEIPPLHPNCRCTIIPSLGEVWLPPAEPWTGAEVPLRTFSI